jgi:DNA-binding Xre family transcriptional regulator
MGIRLRLEELLKERRMSAYALAKAGGGRLSHSTLYRIIRMEGRLATFDAELLDALCDALGVDLGELLERTPAKRKR